jgi:hypothetical protein
MPGSKRRMTPINRVALSLASGQVSLAAGPTSEDPALLRAHPTRALTGYRYQACSCGRAAALPAFSRLTAMPGEILLRPMASADGRSMPGQQ